MSMTEDFGQSGTGVSAGRVLGGRYRLETMIAGGGMGEVYRATRLHIGDEVAVKVLRSELVDNAVTRERFQREARAAAKLRHPNAVVIHDFGEEPDGVAYIVMELLDGRSLRQVLDEEGTLEPARVNYILAQMCAVLAEGHKQGIIHRDLKPENVVLVQRPGTAEQVKLLDFGIAKLLDKELDTGHLEPALTKVGTFIGTPSYMSPEQCQSEPVDERSDIYSLGVMLYELLTGQVPFTAKTPTGVAIKHVMDVPPPLRGLRPELNEAVERVVLRALEKAPEARPASALSLTREFAAALRLAEPGVAANAATGEPAPLNSPSVPTLLDPATQILATPRDTGRQNRETGHQAPSYETSTGAAVRLPASPAIESEEAASEGPSSAGLDTQRLAAGKQNVDAAAPDNSPAALLARLKEQPLLLAAGTVILVLGFLGWWLSSPRRERAGGEAVLRPTPAPVANAPATPTATATPAPAVEDMVYISGGGLLLNATPDSKCPTLAVTVKPFYLDKTEVTNEQYNLFLVANNYTPPPSWKGGLFPAGAEKLPVTDVSWEDAANYAAWAGKRLPTEAEWEFAARGANDWLYPWGNEWRAELANVGGKELQAVGSYPQAIGLFGALDLIGNAAEWTASDYSDCAKEEPVVGSNEITSKVVRGGSYETTAKQATATFRQGLPAKRQGNASFKTVGFRCARDVQ